MVVDYSLGKIYRISSPNHDKCYIGATAHPCLAQPWASHKYNARWGLTNCSVAPIILAGDATLELLETYPCESSEELRKREEYWCQLQGDSLINKNRRYTSAEERKRLQREKAKFMYHNDPEFKAKKRQYYYDNRQLCLERVRRAQEKRKQREAKQDKDTQTE